MNRFVYLFALLIFVSSFVACGDRKDKVQVNRAGRGVSVTPNGGAVGPDNKTPIPNSNGSSSPVVATASGRVIQWGSLTPAGGSVSSGGPTFSLNSNDMSRAFLSVDFQPNEVGATTMEADPTFNMPCVNGQPCFAKFVMPLKLVGGNLSQALNGGASFNIDTNVDYAGGSGFFYTEVYDSLYGKPISDETDELNSQIPALIKVASGTLQGKNLSVQFADQYGTVTITGSVSGSRFDGNISFNNTTNKWSNYPVSGNWGKIQTNICNIFACQ